MHDESSVFVSESVFWDMKQGWPVYQVVKRVKVKSNAESKHICCSFLSIYYQLNPLRETDVKPQFASKISISDVSNDLRPHSPRHLEKQLGNPASFANRASSRTTHSASVALKHLFLCALVLR